MVLHGGLELMMTGTDDLLDLMVKSNMKDDAIMCEFATFLLAGHETTVCN